MIVLGVSNTKDSGACLVIDGKLVAAVNEERLNREKLTRVFPVRSISWLLESRQLKTSDIDAVALGAWKGIDSWRGFPEYVRRAMDAAKQSPEAAATIESRLSASARSDHRLREEFMAGLAVAGLADRPLINCHHHHAHAASAFEYSPYDDALVVTIDGRGDFMSGSVSRWKRGSPPELLRTELELDSFGAFYGWITGYLGFTPDRHEGKVTGLAARGTADKVVEILERMIEVRDGKIVAHIGPNYAPNMRAELPELRRMLAPFSREDIAAGAQTILERGIERYIAHYIAATGSRNLCLAGGIFANVLLNMRLRRIPGVDGFYVFPHMGDGGIAAGAAAYAVRQLGGEIKPLNSCYLGPSFDEHACEAAILKAGLKVHRPPNLAEEVARLAQDGKIVGIFQGGMEFGPRALGNRSIVARATEAGINESLNARLSRSEFMPFAPVSLAEHASSLYAGWTQHETSSRTMTACYACLPGMEKQSPAVVHIDNTARPQVIARADNEFYYDVLEAYWRLTGIPTLINTSFNEHEAPIVCTPEQAIDVLVEDGVDAVAMPPFLVVLR